MNWVNESIMYNIYPLGFCDAPKDNDGILTYRLDKIYEWLPHFKSLNVNAIVFNPVFESTRHGYDTIDYKMIDKRLGDNQSFKKICDTLHQNGIKVILDGVYNHVGRDFWAFKDVQQNLQGSQYCSWFQNLNFGGPSPKGDPFWYEGWAGHFDLVKLNLQNQDVVNYLLDATRFWIDEFDIDGLRLDAADCVDIEFFKKLRKTCEEKKSDFWLYGEITHGDYNRWANPEVLHSVTNYECYKGIYSSHNDHNYFEIAHSLNRQFGNGGIYSNIYTYNFVDNHDVNRIASTLKEQEHLQNVYTLMYCMPGVSSIYYGSEWGIKGQRNDHSDYELRPCINLCNIVHNNLLQHIQKLGIVRKSLEALKYGSFENVVIKNEQLVFKRKTDSQTVYIALNLSCNEQYVDFNIDGNGILTDVSNNNEVFSVDGYANLAIPAFSSRILVLNDGSFKFNFDDTPKEDCKNEDTEPSVACVNPEPIKLGKYRHFKGNEYEVIGIAKHSETQEDMVVYKALYDNSSLWVRPAEMFDETVEHDGIKMKRFEFIG